MRGNHYATKRPPVSDDRTLLTLQLYQSATVVFDSFKLADLQKRYNRLPAKEVEYALTIARQNRAGEPR